MLSAWFEKTSEQGVREDVRAGSSRRRQSREFEKTSEQGGRPRKTMPSGPSSRSGRTKTTTDEPGHIERGSGNVFADLGIPNPDLALAKAELVRRIRDVIAERKLTQAKAAELLGLDQPKVSALVRGRVAGYTIDRLFRFLNALGQRVEITVRPNAKNP
jgi:predicted XRE-type DNA-binding protein